MTATLIALAEAGFDAARRRRDGALTGHGFRMDVSAGHHEVVRHLGPDDGLPLLRLREALDAVAASAEHTLLDERLPATDDAALAGWLAQRLDLPGLQRVGLRSHPNRGVDLRTDGSGVEHWRRYRFESAHRLPHVPLGHKCGRWHGHGFEAIVRARGTDHDALDAAWAPLYGQLHLRRLNDLPGLANPTSEHLARWLWDALTPTLPGLSGVTVYETASCGAHVDGLRWRIWKDFSFDSATRLRRLPASHPRAGLHGHTYTARLHLQAPLDPVLGWAVDFGDVKQAFAPVFDAIDHRSLDDLADPAGPADGDAASLAAWLLAQAQPLLPALFRLDLFETPGCGASAVRAGAEAPVDVPVLRAGS